MMNINQKLNDIAVWWTNPVPDGYGRYTYDAPVEIPCRWEWRQQQYKDKNGDLQMCDGVVYTTANVKPGDALFYGSLSELDSSADYHDEDVHNAGPVFEEKTVDGTPEMRKITL